MHSGQLLPQHPRLSTFFSFLDFTTVCLSLCCLSPTAVATALITGFCYRTEQQQQKRKRKFGCVNVILTKSLETLNSKPGWTASDLRLAQNTTAILSFHSCLRSYWLCSFLVQFKVLCDVTDLPRASLPSTAHHSGYSLTVSHCGHSLIFQASLQLPNPGDFLPLLLPTRHLSAAPSKAAFSVLTTGLYFQLSAAHTPT